MRRGHAGERFDGGFRLRFLDVAEHRVDDEDQHDDDGVERQCFAAFRTRYGIPPETVIEKILLNKERPMPTAPEEMTLKVIAHIHTAFPTKFGIPRQSGLVDSLPGRG